MQHIRLIEQKQKSSQPLQICLRLLDVEVSGLDQLEKDVFDVLAHIARFGERCCISNGKRDIQHSSESLREMSLSASGGTEEKNVALGQLYVLTSRSACFLLILESPVVVVHRDSKDLLGLFLTDHVIIQERANFPRLGQLLQLEIGSFTDLLFDDLIAQVDAFVADVDARTSDQLLHLLLRFTAERTLQDLSCVSEFRHDRPSFLKQDDTFTLFFGWMPEKLDNSTGVSANRASVVHNSTA
jgi:hypothetical protein